MKIKGTPAVCCGAPVHGKDTLRQEHTGTSVGRLKHLGRLRQVREQICLVCSAALEAFGATWMLDWIL